LSRILKIMLCLVEITFSTFPRSVILDNAVASLLGFPNDIRG